MDSKDLKRRRGFVMYFHFLGWWALSLGLHIDIESPNIEIHLPFGFIRVGWQKYLHPEDDYLNFRERPKKARPKTFGIDGRYM